MIGIFKKICSGEPQPPEERLNRNDACWCGNGLKYKRCHLEKDLEKERRRASACRTYS